MRKIKRIAFIDNDEYTNLYHKRLAESSGLVDEVLTFYSMEDAIKQLDEIGQKIDFPQLIFIDVKTPEKDSHRLLSIISELPGFDPFNTVIAFLTNSINIESIAKSSDHNIDLYFWKPLKKDVLEKIMDDHFGN